MATIASSQLVQTLQPGLSAVAMKLYTPKKWFWPDVFMSKSSEQSAEKLLTMAGFGTMPQKDKGSNITMDRIYEGYLTTLTNLTYALAYSIELEAWEDALYGVMQMMAGALGKSARDAVEVAAANVLNNGFDDNFGGGDTEPLFGDASAKTHPLKGGGTSTNTPSSAADLDNVSLEQALIDIMGTVDDRSMKEFRIPSKLVVPPNLMVTATQIVKSVKQAYTAENQKNFFMDMFSVMVNPYLTDTDAWFIVCEEHNMVHQKRKGFSTWADTDPYNQDIIHGGRQRFKFGWSDWRGVYGSPGA